MRVDGEEIFLAEDWANAIREGYFRPWTWTSTPLQVSLAIKLES